MDETSRLIGSRLFSQYIEYAYGFKSSHDGDNIKIDLPNGKVGFYSIERIENITFEDAKKEIDCLLAKLRSEIIWQAEDLQYTRKS